MAKPRVITNCVANHFTPPNQRIIEFSDHQVGPGDGQGPPGGLISFTRSGDELIVRVYRCDPQVRVIVTNDS